MKYTSNNPVKTFYNPSLLDIEIKLQRKLNLLIKKDLKAKQLKNKNKIIFLNVPECIQDVVENKILNLPLSDRQINFLKL